MIAIMSILGLVIATVFVLIIALFMINNIDARLHVLECAEIDRRYPHRFITNDSGTGADARIQKEK